MESFAGDFEPEKFSDEYQDELRKLIEAKLEQGDTIDTAETFGEEEEKRGGGGEVIDLMEALQRSVERSRSGSSVVGLDLGRRRPRRRSRPRRRRRPQGAGEVGTRQEDPRRRSPRDAAAAQQPVGPGLPPVMTDEGSGLRGRGGQPDRRRARAGAHPVAGHPAGLAGRVDLAGRPRAHPGGRHRPGRPAPVPAITTSWRLHQDRLKFERAAQLAETLPAARRQGDHGPARGGLRPRPHPRRGASASSTSARSGSAARSTCTPTAAAGSPRCSAGTRRSTATTSR